MGNTEILYDRIEFYIQNKLSPQEHRNLLKQMSLDPAINREVQFHQELHTALSEHEILRFKQTIQETIQKKKKTQYTGFHFLSIAASFTVLVTTLALYLPQFNSPLTPEEIVAMHFVPYTNITSIRSAHEEQDLFKNGMAAYQSNQYARAIQFLEQIPPDKGHYQMSRFYLGISHLAIKDGISAKKYLSRVFEGSHPFHEISIWYLALAFLQQGDIQNGKKMLKKLSLNKNAHHHHQAKEIVDHLIIQE